MADSEDSQRFDVVYDLFLHLNLWLTSLGESNGEIRFIEGRIRDLKNGMNPLKEVVKVAKRDYELHKALVQSELEKQQAEAVPESEWKEEATSVPGITSDEDSVKAGERTPHPDIAAMQTRKQELKFEYGQLKRELVELKSQYKGYKEALRRTVEEWESISDKVDEAKAGIKDIIKGPQLVRVVHKYHLDSSHPLDFERRVLRVTKGDQKELVRDLIQHNCTLGLGIDENTILLDHARRFSY